MAQGLLGVLFTITESVMILLRGFIEFCDGFFDDIIILSKTIEEHLIHLEKVFKKLDEHGTFISFAKCQFAIVVQQFEGGGGNVDLCLIATAGAGKVKGQRKCKGQGSERLFVLWSLHGVAYLWKMFEHFMRS